MTNLPANVAGAVCYAPFVGWVAAIVLLIVEKEAGVRWHAVQAILLTMTAWVVGWGLGLTIILVPLAAVVWVGVLILELVLAVATYQESKIELPVLGKWTDKIVKKL